MFRRTPPTLERLDLLEQRIRQDLYGERPRTLGRCPTCNAAVRSDGDLVRVDGSIFHGRCAPAAD